MTKKVLVCGGRDYTDSCAVIMFLDWLHLLDPIGEVIHGAARGVDSLAGGWARHNNIKETAVPADWKLHGKAAGAIRNSQMLTLCPDVVVAFPGGNGTADMVKKARKAGVTVIIVPIQQTGLESFYESGDKYGNCQGQSATTVDNCESQSRAARKGL